MKDIRGENFRVSVCKPWSLQKRACRLDQPMGLPMGRWYPSLLQTFQGMADCANTAALKKEQHGDRLYFKCKKIQRDTAGPGKRLGSCTFVLYPSYKPLPTLFLHFCKSWDDCAFREEAKPKQQLHFFPWKPVGRPISLQKLWPF